VETPLALLVGVVFACGLYLVMQRNLLRFVFGLLLLSGSVNLLIFTAGRLTRGAAPIIPDGVATPSGDVANALPQALILTAIVIGFGLIVFAMVLLLRTYERLGTVETAELAAALAAGRSAPLGDEEGPA
jgi:multicomponent Na+:H+ antiporter subunit C